MRRIRAHRREVLSVSREIAGAVSRFWAGGSGPSHSSIASALASAGYEEPDDSGNKQDRTLTALVTASGDTARRVAEELVGLLRSAGYLDRSDDPDVRGLAIAFERAGHRLAEGGYIDWEVGELEPDQSSDSARPLPPTRSEEIVHVSRPDVSLLIDCLRRIPGAVKSLTHRTRERHSLSILDEYDVQDVVAVVLRSLFKDVRPEERCPSYAGSSSTMDFLLKEDRVAIEIKVTRPRRAEKKIKTEILVDIHDYQTHPDVDTMIAVVYDLASTFDNPVGFERDLTGRHNSLDVRVLVVGWPAG